MPPLLLDYHSIDPGSTWRRDRGHDRQEGNAQGSPAYSAPKDVSQGESAQA